MATLSERSRTVSSRKVNQQALLDAAVALLDQGTPYAEIGIDQIVRQAGLSRPTFYSYFDDKRALILHLGAAFEQDVAAITGPWLSFADVSLRETLANVLDHYIRHRGIAGALAEAATYDAEVGAFWRGYHERIRPNTELRIAAGHPELTPAAVAARAYVTIWMTEGSLTEHLALPTVDDNDLVDQLTWMWKAATGADGA